LLFHDYLINQISGIYTGNGTMIARFTYTIPLRLRRKVMLPYGIPVTSTSNRKTDK